MSRSWSFVSSDSNLGLLILLVFHVCASTIATVTRKLKNMRMLLFLLMMMMLFLL